MSKGVHCRFSYGERSFCFKHLFGDTVMFKEGEIRIPSGCAISAVISRDGKKSFSELEDIMGSTSDMAEALQCEILVEEKNEVVRKRKIIVLVASCATLALFVLGIFSYMHFWKKNNMWHIDSVIVYGNEEEAIIDDDLSNVKWFEE